MSHDLEEIIYLESQLEEKYKKYDIDIDKKEKIYTYLNLLKNKDLPTYTHSIRVGLLASKIVEVMYLDDKALFYAGLLHDVGKALVPSSTLKKTDKFNEEDYKKMKPHPKYTHQILSGIFDFSADIAVRHHRPQENYYPKKLPKHNKQYGNTTSAMIEFYALVLSLADFYDAASTRVNEKHGEKRRMEKEEVKILVLEKHPHFEKLITELYDKGIFGSETKVYTTG